VNPSDFPSKKGKAFGRGGGIPVKKTLRKRGDRKGGKRGTIVYILHAIGEASVFGGRFQTAKGPLKETKSRCQAKRGTVYDHAGDEGNFDRCRNNLKTDRKEAAIVRQVETY